MMTAEAAAAGFNCLALLHWSDKVKKVKEAAEVQ
jgi:hypothetical protein